MISVVIASAVFMAAMQASVSAPRSAFSDCLKQATEKAKAEKVNADAFAGYARGLCTAQIGTFRSAVVSFDVKNGGSRKEAGANADLEIEDYLTSSADTYRLRTRSAAPATSTATAAPAPTPPPTPTSTPQ